MAVSAARAAAFEILLRVEQDDSYAAELLHSDALSKLSARDHGLATEIVMGVLRWRSLIDDHLSTASSQKLDRLDAEVLTSLRMGSYQLRFLSRVPTRAAIFESVELVKTARKRSAAPFVNAVLRKIAAIPAEDYLAKILQSLNAETLARNAAHPLWLVTRWAERYGFASAQNICLHNQSVPVTAITLAGEVADAELASVGVQLDPGELLSSARRVVAGGVTSTAAYRDGRIMIQDEASQLVALLAVKGKNGVALDFDRSSEILDCCAAPGRKAAFMARRNSGGAVVAVDYHPHRARLLKSLNRQANVLVVAADSTALPFSRNFDRILADVPCSGTGTLAHNPEIKWRLRPEDLQDLQARQVVILKSAMAQLSPGGTVLYSTCSLETEENEAVVELACGDSTKLKVLDLHSAFDELRQSGELSAAAGNPDSTPLLEGPYLRTIPGVHPCDGFFAALIQKS
jgi:16S rRNA (cytosine967-C5)-methyltransferase